MATGGYHAAYTGVERAKKALEKIGIYDVMELLSIGEPVSQMVSKLNTRKVKFQEHWLRFRSNAQFHLRQN